MKQDIKAVFNLKVARELISQGFNPVKVEINREDNKYLVFKFLSSDVFNNAFEQVKSEYINSIKGGTDYSNTY